MNSIIQFQNPVLAGLNKEADGIQLFLNQGANLEDPASLTVRLNGLDVYLARLGDMLIQAKTMKELAQNQYIGENEDRLNKLTATVSNRQINTYLFEYKMTYDRLDTMYRLCEHLSRDLVTQISYIKKQMETFGA